MIYELVKHKGEEYKVGNAVFLYPNAFMFEHKRKYQESKNSKMSYVDEDTYPEFYRKVDDKSSFSNVDTPEPYHIGYINTIYATTTDILVAPTDIFIKVNKNKRDKMGPGTDIVDNNTTYSYSFFLLYKSFVQNTYE